MKRGLIILILIFGVIFWFWFRGSSEIEQFNGNLSEVGNNFIVVKGTFVDSDENSLSEGIMDLKISIDSSTVIKRVAIKIPNTTEVFTIDSLPKQEMVADLEAMKNDSSRNTVGVSLQITRSFLGNYKAKEITYRTPVFDQ